MIDDFRRNRSARIRIGFDFNTQNTDGEVTFDMIEPLFDKTIRNETLNMGYGVSVTHFSPDKSDRKSTNALLSDAI